MPEPYPKAKQLGKRRRTNPNGTKWREVSDVFNLDAKGEHSCRACGGSELVAAHHAIPHAIGTEESKRDLRNCLPLCFACHLAWHRGRPLSRSVFTSEEWAYLTTVELTGRNVAGYLDRRYPADAPSRATHCMRGHEWTPENTYVNPHYGTRVCRACMRQWEKDNRRARHGWKARPRGRA